MCKLPDDGRIPKHVGAVLSFNVNFIGFWDWYKVHLFVNEGLWWSQDARCNDPKKKKIQDSTSLLAIRVQLRIIGCEHIAALLVYE